MSDVPAIIADPRTPAEAKRHWMIDRLWLGSLVAIILLSAIVGIIWLGVWPAAVTKARLDYLGWIACGLLFKVIFADVAFALGGPVGRWKARWGANEFSAEDDDVSGEAEQAYDGAKV